jgi:hypothetical protein
MPPFRLPEPALTIGGAGARSRSQKGGRLRFDDMIATVLRQSEARPAALAAKWRQLVDLLAQGRGVGDSAAEALAWLRQNQAGGAARGRGARSPGASPAAGSARPRSPSSPRIWLRSPRPCSAGPGSAGEWLDLLPRLGPVARGLLRHRRDLPGRRRPCPRRLRLRRFRAGRRGRVPAGDAHPAAERSEAQIRDLVARIENFRRRRDAAGAAATRPRPGRSRASSGRPDRTESSSGSKARRAGRWSARASPRSPIAASMASTARPPARSRSERRSATPASASRAAAPPPATGGFRAFPSSIRRRAISSAIAAARAGRGVDEVARADGGGGADRPVRHRSSRRFAAPADPRAAHAAQRDHRLRRDDRRPIYGPGAASYRSRAAEIMEQARRLLSAVDDLDTAARIETSRLAARRQLGRRRRPAVPPPRCL